MFVYLCLACFMQEFYVETAHKIFTDNDEVDDPVDAEVFDPAAEEDHLGDNGL